MRGAAPCGIFGADRRDFGESSTKPARILLMPSPMIPVSGSTIGIGSLPLIEVEAFGFVQDERRRIGLLLGIPLLRSERGDKFPEMGNVR